MGKYLEQVTSDYDRGELLYLELTDAYGVKGVHWRLEALREATVSNAKASIIAKKRKFIADTESMGRSVTKNRLNPLVFQLSEISTNFDSPFFVTT